MKNHTKARRQGFTLVELLVVIAIIVALAALTSPAVIGALNKAERTTTILNMKEIYKAMFQFADENDGLFPSEDLAEEYGLSESESSNDLFSQLFAEGTLQNGEPLFWVKKSQVCSNIEPDDATTENREFSEDKTLESGDVGFAYISEQFRTDNSARPLIFDSPPNADGLEFDTELWGKKVLVLRVGGDAKAEKMDKDGNIVDGDGNNIFTNDAEIWTKNHDIQIKYPEK